MADFTAEDLRSRNPTFQTVNDAYILPNDNAERKRLFEMNRALTALFNNNAIRAPVQEPVSTIIDIGCGGGAMTRDLRALFPHARVVYGIDLTPVPPLPGDNSTAAGPRLEFIQGDFYKLAGTDPRLRPGGVDFAWSRLLVCGLTDWPGYLKHVFELLRPGGWAQMSESCVDAWFEPGISARPEGFQAKMEWEWLRATREGLSRRGLDPDAGLNVPGYMRQAGFVDIQQVPLRIPYWKGALEEQPEAKLLMDLLVDDPTSLFWHMIARSTEDMGFSREKVAELQLDCLRDFGEEEGKYRVLFVTIGRRPNLNEY